MLTTKVKELHDYIDKAILESYQKGYKDALQNTLEIQKSSRIKFVKTSEIDTLSARSDGSKTETT